jgi:hypothetical protein
MFGIHEDEELDFEMALSTLGALEKIAPDFVSYSILANYPGTSRNANYELFEPSKSPAWEFFDEGHGAHPYCSDAHAERLMEEVKKRHKGSLKGTLFF